MREPRAAAPAAIAASRDAKPTLVVGPRQDPWRPVLAVKPHDRGSLTLNQTAWSDRRWDGTQSSDGTEGDFRAHFPRRDALLR